EEVRDREPHREQEDRERQLPEIPPGECRDQHPRPILVRCRNQAVSDDGVAVVQHSRLAGRNAVRRLVELEPEAARSGLDAGRDRGRAIAELRLDALGLGIKPSAGGDVLAGERRARADYHSVRGRPRAQNVERLGSTDTESATLAGSEPPEAVVTAEL